MTFTLFTYGTLIRGSYGWPQGKPAMLEGYERIPNPIWIAHGHKPEKAVKTVVPKDGASVDGVLFDVPDNEKRMIDMIDGYEGEYYKRTKVTVKVDGQPVKAWVYVGLTQVEYDAKMAAWEARQTAWRIKHGLNGKNNDGWMTFDPKTGRSE